MKKFFKIAVLLIAMSFASPILASTALAKPGHSLLIAADFDSQLKFRAIKTPRTAQSSQPTKLQTVKKPRPQTQAQASPLRGTKQEKI